MAFARKDVYEMVTAKIVEQLKAGVVPWHKPWSTSYKPAQNLKSKKPYRGINAVLLGCSGFASPYWVTYKQAEEMGGNIKKGEKGTPVVLWKWTESKTEEGKRYPFLRYFTLFNTDQTENIDVPVDPAAKVFAPIEAAAKVVEGYSKGPAVMHGGDVACYSPLRDTISMPVKEAFESPELYYSVLFHEMTHSTGHKTRLNRPSIAAFDTFGSHQYTVEELVAEMGAAFLGASAGIHAATLNDSAAYISSWLQKLQNDTKMVVQAAGQAQKAVDLILGTTFAEEEVQEAA